MAKKEIRFFSVFLLLAGVFLLSPKAYAVLNVTSVTVDGGSSTTVTPGSSINVQMFVTSSGGGSSNDWQSSRWRFAGIGSWTCVDHSDVFTSGNHTITFPVSAPTTDGSYDLIVRAYNNDSCSGANSGNYRMNDAVTVSTGGLSCVTFRDEFSSESYSRQNGSAFWETDWIEVSDNGNPSNGDIEISGDELRLEGDGGGSTVLGGPYIYREADLSAYSSATFSFDYRETGDWEGNDNIDIYIYDDAAGNWVRLRRFTNDQSPGTFSQDISSYISANTRIAFVELADSGSEIFYFDDVQIEACTSAGSGPTPLAWFQLDGISGSASGTPGEIIDQEGNFNSASVLGSSSGTDFVPAQVCQGVSVPANSSTSAQYGVDTGIDVDDDIGGQGSISFWYSSNNAWAGGGNRSLFDASPDSLTNPDEYFLLSLRNDGSLVFGLEDSSDGDFRIYTGVQNIAADAWVHLAVTWDINGERRLYLNGTLIGSESASTNGIIGEFDTLYFGDNRSTYHPDGSANSANGIIDEIRIYQGIQTQAEIVANMNATHPCINSPVAEFRLDENSWSGAAGEVLDSSGNGLHGQAILGATPVPARVCNGASLGGSAYINIADDPLLDINDELTVTAWVRPDMIPASELKTIISKDENFEFHINSAGQIFWWWQWATLTTSGTPLTAGNWYHVAIVYSDAADLQEIYIDGVLRASSTRSGLLDLNNDPLQIGADQGFSGREFEGLIDEVRVYNGALSSTQINAVMNQTRVCSVSGPDHYAISHSLNGITCEAETITITPHDVSHNPIAPNSSTTITLSTSLTNNGWSLITGNGSFNGVDQYTFDGRETRVQFGLRSTAAVTGMDIDVTDGIASDLDDGGSEDPPLDFANTGLRFYADTVHNTIGPQIAGKSSSITPGNQILTLRAIQTNTNTMACEARVNGQHTVRMAFECINPTACETANGVTVIDSALAGVGDTLVGNPQGGSINYSDVDLTFDATGTATWTMTYADAGQIQLHAELVLAASDPDPAITLSGTSNLFVSSPAGFCVESTDTDAGCGGGAGLSCTGFQAAGTDFNLTIRAVDWENATESNAGFCTGNSITPNFQLASIPLTLGLVSPSGGTTGSLGIMSFTISNADNGSHTITGQTISEVGVFRIATTDITYLGQTILASSSDDIGRFYPAEFVLSGGLITNRSDLPLSGGIFTYMDEDFDIDYTITAYNAASPAGVTQNYEGTFAQLDDASELNYAAVDTTAPVTLLTSRLTTGTAPTINWNNGVLTMSDTVSISRSGSPDGPFIQLSIGVAPIDEDGVLLDSYDLDALLADGNNDRGLIDSTEIRYGRMRLQNVFGSELVSLTMPMQAEYFDGTSFIPNPDDNLTPLAITDLILFNDVETGQIDGDIQVRAGQTSQIVAASFNSPLSSGDANLVFCPPGNPACTPTAGNAGFIDVTLNLSAHPYLQYDWDTALPGDENPQGRASFGIYDGNPRQIYYRRIYQQ